MPRVIVLSGAAVDDGHDHRTGANPGKSHSGCDKTVGKAVGKGPLPGWRRCLQRELPP